LHLDQGVAHRERRLFVGKRDNNQIAHGKTPWSGLIDGSTDQPTVALGSGQRYYRANVRRIITAWEVRRSYALRTGLPRYKRNTIVSAEALGKATATALAQGFAFDDEEAELGVGCIGVLIRNADGQAVAGLSVSAPRGRRSDAWVPLVQEAGRRLSARLGYLEAEAPAGGAIPVHRGSAQKVTLATGRSDKTYAGA
jgi:hypothetical protein